jgi:pyrroloquinoline quinone biosynthesis protein B
VGWSGSRQACVGTDSVFGIFRAMDNGRLSLSSLRLLYCASLLVLSSWVTAQTQGVGLVVLGNVQDGGYPHIGCERPDCRNLFLRPATSHHVVSLGIVERNRRQQFLFEATPDLTKQAFLLSQETGGHKGMPDGIFLTHAHLGHYSGLGFLGREAMGARGVPVYAMPRLLDFFQTNGPWSQLVGLGNIQLKALEASRTVDLGPELSVTPFLVPHRDEFSETVGYHIQGPNKSVLFIPDIDKWSEWDRDINAAIDSVDFAFLDGTFFDAEELGGHRDMSEIPHPFVLESLAKFATLSSENRNKVHFIHLNHTNALLDPNSPAVQRVKDAGHHVARQGDRFEL